MRKFEVGWVKTYHAIGAISVGTETEMTAVHFVEENIGDCEGSMQYDPDKDCVYILKEVK